MVRIQTNRDINRDLETKFSCAWMQWGPQTLWALATPDTSEKYSRSDQMTISQGLELLLRLKMTALEEMKKHLKTTKSNQLPYMNLPKVTQINIGRAVTGTYF